MNVGGIDGDVRDLAGSTQHLRRRDRREIHVGIAARDRGDGLRRAPVGHVNGQLLMAILTMSRNAKASPKTLCKTPMPFATLR